MSHELTFAESALPVPTVILGLPLKPYALGHELVLLAKHSPFLCLSRKEFDAQPRAAQIFDLTFALGVCAETPPRWWLWRWLNRRADWPLAIAEFRNYLEASRRLLPALSSNHPPDVDAYEMANAGEKLERGRAMGSPLIAHLIVFCLQDMRLTYAEALESPFGVVANLYFTALEAKGQLYIENPAEAEARAELAATRAEVLSETELAQQAWEKAVTPEEKAAAYAAHPRIGNLFATAFYKAADDAARSDLVNEWGIVATTELAKAGIILKEVV